MISRNKKKNDNGIQNVMCSRGFNLTPAHIVFASKSFGQITRTHARATFFLGIEGVKKQRGRHEFFILPTVRAIGERSVQYQTPHRVNRKLIIHRRFYYNCQRRDILFPRVFMFLRLPPAHVFTPHHRYALITARLAAVTLIRSTLTHVYEYTDTEFR